MKLTAICLRLFSRSPVSTFPGRKLRRRRLCHPRWAAARRENRQDAYQPNIVVQATRSQPLARARKYLTERSGRSLECHVLPDDRRAHAHHDGYEFRLLKTRDFSPREALNGARNARVTLEAGFTTIRNVGRAGHRCALRDAITLATYPDPDAGQRPALSITADTATTISCRLSLTCRTKVWRWCRGGPAQDAGDHQVRRRPDQNLCHCGVLSHGDNPRLAVHARRDEAIVRTRTGWEQGCGSCAWSGGHPLGVGGGWIRLSTGLTLTMRPSPS